METFTIRLTEIYFSKWRLWFIRISTLTSGLSIFLINLYFDITGYIPIELKLVPFLGQTFLSVLILILVSFVLIYLAIKTSDKSYHGTFQINENGLKLDLGNKIRLIPWILISRIETSPEEWKIETTKRVFWVKFIHNYERYKADTILKEKIAEKQLSINYERI